MDGMEPKKGAMIGTSTHWSSMYKFRHLEYLAGRGGISKKLKDIDIARPNMANVIRYLVMNGRLCAKTL